MEQKQQKTRKKQSRKDPIAAQKTTAKNKALRAARHKRRVERQNSHRRDWAARHGVGGSDLSLPAKDLRTLVWILRNDRTYAEQYRGQ